MKNETRKEQCQIFQSHEKYAIKVAELSEEFNGMNV